LISSDEPPRPTELSSSTALRVEPACGNASAYVLHV
jgi:hypothetical protein